MIGIVLAAHGHIATALLAAAQSALSDLTHVVAIGIESTDDAQMFERRLGSAVSDLLAETDSVLLLTDMFGGSPSNVGMTLHQEGRVEILTGVNLPMLLKVLQSRLLPLSLLTVAEHGRQSALRSIAIASEVLSSKIPAPARAQVRGQSQRLAKLRPAAHLFASGTVSPSVQRPD